MHVFWNTIQVSTCGPPPLIFQDMFEVFSIYQAFESLIIDGFQNSLDFSIFTLCNIVFNSEL